MKFPELWKRKSFNSRCFEHINMSQKSRLSLCNKKYGTRISFSFSCSSTSVTVLEIISWFEKKKKKNLNPSNAGRVNHVNVKKQYFCLKLSLRDVLRSLICNLCLMEPAVQLHNRGCLEGTFSRPLISQLFVWMTARVVLRFSCIPTREMSACGQCWAFYRHLKKSCLKALRGQNRC